MDTTILVSAGKDAGELRQMIETANKADAKDLTKKYGLAIKAIDAEVARLKKLHPNRFWKTSSKEYQAMAYRWAAARKAREEAAHHEHAH
jgi:hypothetical protein